MLQLQFFVCGEGLLGVSPDILGQITPSQGTRCSRPIKDNSLTLMSQMLVKTIIPIDGFGGSKIVLKFKGLWLPPLPNAY